MRRLISILLLLLAAGPAALPAQRADSAATARGLFRRAAELLAARDTAAALDSALAATRAWPRQGAYLLAAARLAASAGRPSLAVELLDRATRMGFGFDPAGEPYHSLGGTGGFDAVARRATANRQPLVASSIFRRLADSTLHPEGVAWDPTTGRVFVSSVRHRKVVVIEPDGRVRDFAAAPVLPLDAVFGMAVDTARGVLWLATSATPEQLGGDSLGAAIVGVDLATGALRERRHLATPGGHLLGDVVLAPDGSVWATDSRAPGIYRFHPGDGDDGLALVAASPDWGSPQGLAFDRDGVVAWVADWTTGLHRLEVATGRVEPVAADPELFTLGIDGLYAVGPSRLVAIQNGISPARVALLDLDREGRRVVGLTVLDRHLPLAEEPTLGAPVPGGLLYVGNAPWGRYGAGGKPDPARPFPPPVLLRLPLVP